MLDYSRRSNPEMYEVWAHVKRKTDERAFLTFQSFLKHVPSKPKLANGRRVAFLRPDKSLPYSRDNGRWAVYQVLPEPTYPPGEFEGAPPNTSNLLILGRRTATLWDAMCLTTGLYFATSRVEPHADIAPKAGTSPSCPCPCCAPLIAAPAKRYRTVTPADLRRDERDRVAYAARTLALPNDHGLSSSEVLAAKAQRKAQEKEERRTARIQAKIAALQASLV